MGGCTRDQQYTCVGISDLKIVDPSGLGKVILGAEHHHSHLLLLPIFIDVLLNCLNNKKAGENQDMKQTFKIPGPKRLSKDKNRISCFRV